MRKMISWRWCILAVFLLVAPVVGFGQEKAPPQAATPAPQASGPAPAPSRPRSHRRRSPTRRKYSVKVAIFSRVNHNFPSRPRLPTTGSMPAARSCNSAWRLRLPSGVPTSSGSMGTATWTANCLFLTARPSPSMTRIRTIMPALTFPAISTRPWTRPTKTMA